MNKKYTFTVDKNIAEAFKDRCDKEARVYSKVVSRLMEKYIADNPSSIEYKAQLEPLSYEDKQEAFNKAIGRK